MENRRLAIQAVIESLETSRYKNSLGGVGVKLSGTGQIVLFGKVKTYFLKQMAQESALKVLAQTAYLENQISVDYGSQP